MRYLYVRISRRYNSTLIRFECTSEILAKADPEYKLHTELGYDIFTKPENSALNISTDTYGHCVEPRQTADFDFVSLGRIRFLRHVSIRCHIAG